MPPASWPEPGGAAPAPEPGALERHLGKKLPDLLPARMVNEFVYCPRLFYYEWVEKVFVGSADTAEGRARHRRVEAEADALPAAAEVEPEKIHSRSIELSSPRLGLIAKLDLIESAPGDASVTPVDYKKGRPRESAGDAGPAAWPADRAQIAAQVAILRDNGYACDGGVLYYAATKQRVRVVFDAALESELLATLAAARAAAASDQIPPPLVDSPKCPRCSLVGICLPDETNALRARLVQLAPAEPAIRQLPLFAGVNGARESLELRPLVVPRDECKAVYLNTQGWRVGKSGEVFQVRGPAEGKGRSRPDEVKLEFRLGEISQVNVFGSVQITTQALQALCEAEVPVCFYSQGGYFYGLATGLGLRNVFLRRTQFLSAENPALALALARRLVAGKIRNQRVMLQRNHIEPPEDALRLLRALADNAEAAASPETLLGIEGAAARAYFAHFAGMLKVEAEGGEAADAAGELLRFDFQGRNRRPPLDPVNALLSLAYAMLAKDATIVCLAAGFDPFWGFYHQPRFGRPSLALDLMEPFRPLVADSVVLTAINTGMIRARDFVRAGPGVALRPEARRTFYYAYEQRIESLVTHPLFGYRCSYRRMLEIQTRLFARWLTGEIPEYPVFTTR
ncbi:MAG TPA: CRISPR-associated endonuclease Cas1 [Terriglobales bacterium]|nr:CRISPR-associated endonuclease Cas1 [Terriglobales bacterium]